MPTVSTAAALVVQGVVDELGALQPEQVSRITSLQGARDGGAAQARAQALNALADAGRLGHLDAATQRIAEACISGEVPQPVRSAAYDALVALMARDLIPDPAFRALYELWDEGTGAPGRPKLDDGEELLLHIG